MTKILKFDAAVASMVAAEVMKKLKDVEEQFGIRIVRDGGGRYDDHSFSFKIAAKVIDKEGVSTGDEESFKRRAKFFDLEPEWFNREFTFQGTVYRVAGINPKKHKNVVKIVRVRDGKNFTCAPFMVQHGLSQGESKR